MDIAKIKKGKLGQCQVESCNDPAKWGIYRTLPDGKKVWIYVCRLHEGIIGAENLARGKG